MDTDIYLPTVNHGLLYPLSYCTPCCTFHDGHPISSHCELRKVPILPVFIMAFITYFEMSEVIDKDPEFEIVGLRESGNGRSCCAHECCGSAIVPGSLVRIHCVHIDGTVFISSFIAVSK